MRAWMLLFRKLPERLNMSEANDAPKDAKRPWFKKKRFWAIGVVLLVIVMQTSGGGAKTDSNDTASDTATEAAAAPAEKVTAEKLLSDLDGNPLAAKNSWKDKRVTITGTLDNIDASGNYFTLRGNEEFTLINVMVYIDDSFVDAVSAFTKGQSVTVTGTISDVGEIMGYSVDAESIP